MRSVAIVRDVCSTFVVEKLIDILINLPTPPPPFPMLSFLVFLVLCHHHDCFARLFLLSIVKNWVKLGKRREKKRYTKKLGRLCGKRARLCLSLALSTLHSIPFLAISSLKFCSLSILITAVLF